MNAKDIKCKWFMAWTRPIALQRPVVLQKKGLEVRAKFVMGTSFDTHKQALRECCANMPVVFLEFREVPTPDSKERLWVTLIEYLV